MQLSKRWFLRAGVLGMIMILFLGSSVLAQGQGGQGGGDDKSKKQYAIEVTPSMSELQIAGTVQFTAQILDSNGSPVEGTVTWSVTNKNVGEIDENGLFTAIGSGHTNVMASYERCVGRAEVIVRCDTCDPDQIQNQKEGLRVVVDPAGVNLEMGETQQFTAGLVDSSGNVLPAVFEWGVEGEFGTVDETGLFEASQPGKGFVVATAGDLSGRAHVVVKQDPNNGAGQGVRKSGTKMVLVPEDTLVLVGNVVQYQAFLRDTLGNETEVYPEWEVRGRDLGTIDESGLFTADSSGNCLVKAVLEHYTGTARVRIATTEDTAKAKKTEFKMKNRDGNQVGNVKRIDESDVFKISGMPFPLNLLNGCEVILPAGALDQDITIDVSIPSIAEIRGDTTVTFAEAILNGISFDVYVDGVLVSPYVFEEPVQIVIPYKTELMEDLGLELEDLWVFFYSDEAGYVDDGLYNIYVDTTNSKIIVEVSHFSEIVIGDKALASLTGVSSGMQPGRYELLPNVPNPFNPETSIRFNLAGVGMQHITVRIFNLLGQEVRTLASREFAPGSHKLIWNGRDQSGLEMSSGVYLVRLEGADFAFSERMLLLR